MDESEQSDEPVRHPVRAFLLTPVLMAPICILSLADWSGFSPSHLLDALWALKDGEETEQMMSNLLLIVLAGIIGGLTSQFLPLGGPSLSAQGYECQAVFAGLPMPCNWASLLNDLVPFVGSGLVGGGVIWRLYSGRWV